MQPPSGRDWVALSPAPLPVAEALTWVVTPGCGATVCFVGTVRDHAEDRVGVERLTYEAYEEVAVARLQAVADEVRARWPMTGRVALLHRTGALAVGDAAVAIVVSTPHRGAAFAAAEFAIDAVKATVPIWKQEEWSGGVDWGTGAEPLRSAGEVAGRVR